MISIGSRFRNGSCPTCSKFRRRLLRSEGRRHDTSSCGACRDLPPLASLSQPLLALCDGPRPDLRRGAEVPPCRHRHMHYPGMRYCAWPARRLHRCSCARRTSPRPRQPAQGSSRRSDSCRGMGGRFADLRPPHHVGGAVEAGTTRNHNHRNGQEMKPSISQILSEVALFALLVGLIYAARAAFLGGVQ